MSAEAASSGFSIDPKSLLIYIVNFGIIIFLIERFVARKVLKMIDDRRAMISHNLEAAERLRVEFEQEVEKRQAEALQEAKELKARVEHMELSTKAEVAALLEKAEADRTRIVEETEAQVESMRMSAMKQIQHEATSRVAKAAEIILGEEVPEQTVKASVERAFAQLKKSSSDV